MAKRQAVLLCSRCEAPFRSEAAFCAECGGPSPWATHEDRVAWEVRQWRASRAREPERATPMMLVRTDEGFTPAPLERTQYVWDQPLHPEREQQHTPTNGHGNGNGSNGHTSNGHPPTIPYAGVATDARREPAVVEPPQAERAPEPVRRAEPVEPLAVPVPEPSPAPAPGEVANDGPVSISKKAVAVAIAIALGLPLGSKALNLSRSEPEAARAPRVAAGAPAPLAAARTGFVQLSGDAVRYAVLVRNPNKSLSAREVGVTISLFDAKGRLVGTDVERLPVVPAASTAAIAGVTDVDGRVARLAVRLSSDGFVDVGTAKPFAVRSVALSRSGPDLVVRTVLSAAQAARGARVVVVHLDARGAIVGGDVAYVDIPRSPRTVTASIVTAGAGGLVRRVQVYVLAPR